MANKFLDDNGLLYFWQKIKNAFATKDELNNSKVTVIDSLTSTSTTEALSAKQGKVLDEKIGAINTNMENLGAGDMLKSKYDVNDNGQVDKADDADKLGGQSPDYYAPASSLNDYVSNSKVGQANGVASLGADGKVPESQLPETAPAEHKHEIGDINGLPEGIQEMTNALNGKASTADLEEAVEEMTEIASGKCASYVFDTVADLETWLGKNENTSNLKTGDVFLIRAIDVPDYWWEPIKEGVELTKYTEKDIVISGVGAARILETTKVDLSTISNPEIDTIVAS